MSKNEYLHRDDDFYLTTYGFIRGLVRQISLLERKVKRLERMVAARDRRIGEAVERRKEATT